MCICASCSVILFCLALNSCTSKPEESIPSLLERIENKSHAKVSGLAGNESLIIGKLVSDMPLSRLGPLEMALMIYSNDGTVISDYFAPERNDIDTDITTRNIPRIFWKLSSFEKGTNKGSKDVVRFAEAFPEFLDEDFTLTFKRFDSHAFYLKNVPEGTAFVWLMTDLDMGKLSQMPCVLELHPVPGEVVREDLVFEVRQYILQF